MGIVDIGNFFIDTYYAPKEVIVSVAERPLVSRSSNKPLNNCASQFSIIFSKFMFFNSIANL